LSFRAAARSTRESAAARELLVCDAPAQTDLGKLGYIPPEKILYRIDLAGIRPMKVQLGDINGDGVCEISVCVYKTTTFHPVLAKRPFFFDLVDGNLIPVWLGSRLSRPFDDYILYDIDGDASTKSFPSRGWRTAAGCSPYMTGRVSGLKCARSRAASRAG
jgi:hypothetical protein